MALVFAAAFTCPSATSAETMTYQAATRYITLSPAGERLVEVDTPHVRAVKAVDDKLAIWHPSDKLVVHGSDGILFEVPNVSGFDLSSSFFAYETLDRLFNVTTWNGQAIVHDWRPTLATSRSEVVAQELGLVSAPTRFAGGSLPADRRRASTIPGVINNAFVMHDEFVLNAEDVVAYAGEGVLQMSGGLVHRVDRNWNHSIHDLDGTPLFSEQLQDVTVALTDSIAVFEFSVGRYRILRSAGSSALQHEIELPLGAHSITFTDHNVVYIRGDEVFILDLAGAEIASVPFAESYQASDRLVAIRNDDNEVTVFDVRGNRLHSVSPVMRYMVTSGAVGYAVRAGEYRVYNTITAHEAVFFDPAINGIQVSNEFILVSKGSEFLDIYDASGQLLDAVIGRGGVNVTPFRAVYAEFCADRDRRQRGAIVAVASCRVPVGRSIGSADWTLLSGEGTVILRSSPGLTTALADALGDAETWDWLRCCD